LQRRDLRTQNPNLSYWRAMRKLGRTDRTSLLACRQVLIFAPLIFSFSGGIHNPNLWVDRGSVLAISPAAEAVATAESGRPLEAGTAAAADFDPAAAVAVA
jgi:hypothetical protein